METGPLPDMCRLCEELASQYDIKGVLSFLSKTTTELLGVKGCTIRLLDEKNKTLEIVAAYGLSRAYLEKGPVLVEKHHIDQKVLKGQYVFTKDITAEPHIIYLEEAKKEGIRSVLSMPFMVKQRAIGVIRVYTSVPHDFTDEEIKRLRSLASLGGILADRARLWQEMHALIETARSITSTLSLNEVLSKLVESAAKALGFRAASIRLLDAEKKCLEVKATYGLSRAYLEKGAVEVEKSLIDKECLEGTVVIVPDIRKDSRLQYPEEILKEGIEALITVPLLVRTAAIGVLRVYASVPYTFMDSETEFLSAIAAQGAIAIDNARLFEHIKSEYEDLTKDVWKWYDWGERFPKI